MIVRSLVSEEHLMSFHFSPFDLIDLSGNRITCKGLFLARKLGRPSLYTMVRQPFIQSCHLINTGYSLRWLQSARLRYSLLSLEGNYWRVADGVIYLDSHLCLPQYVYW